MIDLLTKVLNMRWDFFFNLNLGKSGDFFHFIPYRSLDYFHSIMSMDHYYYYILKNIIGQGKKFQRHLHIQMVFSLEKKQELLK